VCRRFVPLRLALAYSGIGLGTAPAFVESAFLEFDLDALFEFDLDALLNSIWTALDWRAGTQNKTEPLLFEDGPEYPGDLGSLVAGPPRACWRDLWTLSTQRDTRIASKVLSSGHEIPISPKAKRQKAKATNLNQAAILDFIKSIF